MISQEVAAEVRAWLTKEITRDQLKTDYPRLVDWIDEQSPDDQFWVYSTPSDSWERLGGEAGIAVVRNGEVIDRTILINN